MHWSKQIATDIITRYPDLNEYVVASGISPSGSVHIGNYREFITNYYVAKSLQSLGKKVKMIFSWDGYDRLRKVPKNIAEKVSGFEKYAGAALGNIPDPFGEFSCWAERFEREFESSLKTLQMNEVPMKFIYQRKEYPSGRYNDQILFALKKRKEIYDILISFKTQESDEGERENYYPVQIYCPKCLKDSTRVLSVSENCEQIEYQCACGESHKIDVKSANNIKLVWKVDWAMRWKYEGVIFEAAGPDHHSAGGSYDVSSRIAREIFGYTPPMSCSYGFIGLKGMSSDKMSSSTGAVVTPADCLKVYEPEIIRYLFAKYDNGAYFDFGFDDTIVRHYTEFDKSVKNFFDGTITEEYDRSVYELCLFNDTKSSNRVSFSTLATVAPLAEFNEKLICTMLKKADIEFTAESTERVQKVKFWLENYQSDKIYKLRDSFNAEFYATLNDAEKAVLKKLYDFLNTENTAGAARTEKEIQEYLYQIINNPDLTKKENIMAQQRYFKIFYNMLFGRDDGPRLYLYLAVADKSKYLKLLSK